MISEKLISQVRDRLVDAYDPVEIYLFGSYAWAKPDDESDLDLLVVVEQSSLPRHKRSLAASKALIDLKIPKDIIVFTKVEFEKFSKKTEYFKP